MSARAHVFINDHCDGVTVLILVPGEPEAYGNRRDRKEASLAC